MAMLAGKALVQGNPRVHNNLWKPEVIKPFPSHHFRAHRTLKITGETGKPLGSVVDLFAMSRTTMFSRASPLSFIQKKNFSMEDNEGGERYNRRERTERPPKPARLIDIPILTLESIELDNINFEAVETGMKGNLFLPLTFNGKNIRIETPILRAPFGLKRFTHPSGKEDANLNLAFEMNSSDPSHKMLTFLQALEEKIVKHTTQNADTYFPHLGDKSAESIQSIFRPSLRPPKEAKFSPLWKMKVPLTGRGAEFYYKEDKIPPEEIISQTRLTSVVELKGVWFQPEAFGVSWTLLQSKIEEIPPPKRSRRQQEGDNFVNESQ